MDNLISVMLKIIILLAEMRIPAAMGQIPSTIAFCLVKYAIILANAASPEMEVWLAIQGFSSWLSDENSRMR